MIKIRTLDDLRPLPARVFYRVDYNVPLEGTRVSDATRIEETLPTLRRLRDAGCSVVIASHLGRPKGQRNPKYSLAPVRAKLAELLDCVRRLERVRQSRPRLVRHSCSISIVPFAL